MPNRVSIVTSVLNSAATLRQCLESVAGQTVSCEHIVVDGGSTDGSLDLARSHAGVKLIEAKGAGIARAFNIGIAHSTGDLIGILNADDWLEPDAVARSVQVLQEHSGAGFSYGSVIEHAPNYDVVIEPLPPDRFFDQCVVQLPFPHISSLVRRSVYERCGLYDETFAIAMDLEFYARIIRGGIAGARVTGVLGHVRAGGVSARLWARKREDVRLAARYIGMPRAVYHAAVFGARALAFAGLGRMNWGARWLRQRASRFRLVDPQDKLIS